MADKEAWKNRIIKDLKEKDFNELISNTEDGIEILPFYTTDDNHKYQLEIPTTSYQDCLNTAIVKVSDAKAANAQAIQLLQKGIQAIIFDVENKDITQLDVDVLVQDIQAEYAPIFFDNYIQTSKHILEDKIPKSTISKIYVPQQKSKVNELLYALLRIYHSDETQFRVHFIVGQNFFLEVAKFRAFRWLLAQLNRLHQSNKEITLIAETGFENRSDDVLENNILRNTTETMSAILGACFGIIVHPHENTNLSNRIARNVKNILSLESNFKIEEEFTKGSYYVEYLTYQLAQKTWDKL